MWPFKKKTKPTKPPEEVWLEEFFGWLDDFQKLASKFPDHTSLEGHNLKEPSLRLLDDITDVYSEDMRMVLERFVLKGESFRRSISSK